MSGRRIPYGEGRSVIIRAAIRLVAREGLPRLSFRALAAEAGLSAGAVRHSFPTIDDLLAGVLDAVLDESLAALAEAETVPDVFEKMLEAIGSDAARAAFEVKVMTEASHRPELMVLAERYYAGFAEYMTSFLRAHSLPADAATVEALIAFADGMNYQIVIFGESHKERMRLQIAGLEKMLGAMGEI